MARSWNTCVALSAWLLLISVLARAQTGTGSIAGAVKDATGAVLPGVTVEASSPALIEKGRTVVTDGEGQYKIVELRPGVYTVTFTLPGFNTVRREGIELTTGFTATVNADLKVGDVSETITVSGQTPIVDIQNVAQARVLTRDALDQVPTAKLYTNLGILLPGAVPGGVQRNSQDVGGATGQSFVILGIHGGRVTDEQVQLNGMQYQMQFAQGGASPVLVPVDGSIEEYNLEFSAHSAEMETGGLRINIVPKDGGNTYRGTFFSNFTDSRLNTNNFDDTIRQRGLNSTDKVKNVWIVNPAFGGPLVKDRLWFLGAYHKGVSENYVAGTYYNKTPGTFFYSPDLSRPGIDDQRPQAANLRLTAQVSPKNKLSVYYDHNVLCACHYLIGPSGLGAIRSPEASWYTFFLNRTGQVSWTSPITNRLLFDAAGSFYNVDYLPHLEPEASGSSITELNGNLQYGSTSYSQLYSRFYHARSALSYVTGAHALKIGMEVKVASAKNVALTPGNVTYTMLNQMPSAVTYFATPYDVRAVLRPNLGAYVQDQWTQKRLTVNGGLRFDWFRTAYPSYSVPATQYVPQRDVVGAGVLNWKDLNPRLGAAYDVSGNGKTALKVSLSRYVVQEVISSLTSTANPISASNNNNTRSWNDLNGDYAIAGDPLNPAANGELGPSSNRFFGQTVITTHLDPNWTNGFDTREYNWEFATGIQHQLASRLSVNASYFRRWYGNFRVTQNRAVTSSDYDPYCITAPADQRLPGGGGQPICGLYDVKLARVGQVDNFVSRSETFGNQYEHWNGGDVTVNARFLSGGLLQGGLSTGKTMADNCDIVTKIANAPATSGGGPSTLYCHVESPLLTQLKLIGSYALPWQVQVSGTFQSVPGPLIIANYVATNTAIAPSLGRNLAAGVNGTATINLIPTGQAPPQGGGTPAGTLYGDRLKQIDFRIAKTFHAGQRIRIQPQIDLYNVLNANTILRENTTYGTSGASWRQATLIETGRLIKFGVNVNF